MKITCQACQAKYTIADDKVAGKVVKIRCKKCGASIVVNGNESQALSSSSSSSAPPGPGGAFEEVKPTDKDAWTVNVADGDQRTMTEAEIVDTYRAGVINDDTFCWREGMADWLSLQEIAPLHAACKKMRSGAPGARPSGALPAVVADPTAGPGAAAAGARLPPRPSDRAPAKDGNGAGALAAPAPATAARRVGGRGTTADLFSGASQAGGDDEVMTSAPVGVPEPHADGQKPTGARNDNSVLFALKDKGEAPPPQGMTASNEASGLIDIRQLSAQMHSAAEKREKNTRVDDIMNLGASAGLSPNLGAPLLSAPSLEHYSQPPPSLIGSMGGVVEAKNKALVFLSLGAGTFFLVAAIGIAVLLFRGKDSSSAEGEKTAASASASAKSAAPTASGSETPQPSAAPEAPSATATESAAAAPAPAKEAKETATKETPSWAAPKEPKATAPPPPKETAPPTAAPAAEFNMGEARSRLASVAAGAQTCKRGDTVGSGRVEIIFSPSGAVQSANLMPGSPFDGTPTGKCIEARFRGARVPAFGGSPFTVTKSFSIN